MSLDELKEVKKMPFQYSAILSPHTINNSEVNSPNYCHK